MEILFDINNIMLPEVVLTCFIVIQILLAMFMDAKYYKLSKWISVLGIFLSTSMCLKVESDPIYYGFKLSLISDIYTLFFKFLILVSGFLLLFLTKKAITANRTNAFKFNALYLSALLGALLLVSANDFLVLYAAMEFISLSVMYMVLFDKGYKAKEAGFKYIIMNIVASLIYLFGVSYLYGMTQSFNFTVIYEYFNKGTPTLLYTMSGFFICAGLMLKLGIMPFANWITDVYEGCGTSVAAFISVVPKVAMFSVLCRLLVFALSFSFELTFALVLMATVTALWANYTALRQKNIKKLLACSSSANASYIMFAAALVSVYNLSTVIFYLTAYVFMNIGAFAAVAALETSEFSNRLYEFKNFAYSNPIFALSFAICLLSLAGIPITVGFFAKVYLFSAILRSGLVFLPFLILIIMSIIVAMFYYLKVIRYMFEPADKNTGKVISHKVSSTLVILYSCAFIIILAGLLPDKIIELCQFVAYNA